MSEETMNADNTTTEADTMSAIMGFLSDPEEGQSASNSKAPVDETEVDDISDESAHTEDDIDEEVEPVNEDETDSEDSEEDDNETSKRTFEDDEEFEIEINGEPVTVTGSEIKNGYLRHSDYTKKTQEISNERKALAEKQTKILQDSQAIQSAAVTRLEQMDATIEQHGGWQNLSQTADPQQLEEFKQVYSQAQQEAQYAKQMQESYEQEVRQTNSATIKGILDDMKNTRHNFDVTELGNYLTSKGFTEDVVIGITDPNAWDMMHKAMLYDKAQERTKGDSKKKQPNETPKHAPTKKTKSSSTKSRKADKSFQNLQNAVKSGDSRKTDAAAIDAIKNFL